MELLLLKYGYLLLFLGIIFEGEAFLLAGAFLSNRGYFDIRTVALVAFAANTLSTQFYYMAARVRGRRWFEKRFGEASRYRKVAGWTHRHGNWLLVVSRFAIGFRIVIPAACGAFGMPFSRFLLLNMLSGLLWVVPTVLVGYYFGATLDSVLREAQEYAAWVLVAILLTAAVLLSIRNIRRVRSFYQHLEWSDLHAGVPFVMGFMGVINIVSAIWPSSEAALDRIRAWLPLEVSQDSRMLMLFTGAALLQVTRDLSRRKQLAWYVAVIALSSSLLLHIISGLDVQNSLVAGLLLFYLIYFRRRFYTRTDPASLRKALLIAPLLLITVFLYSATGLLATYSQFEWPPGSDPVFEAFRTGILILSPTVVASTQYAKELLASIQITGWIARIYILILLLRPVILRDRLEAPADAIERIFRRYGDDSVSAFAVKSDKHHLLVAGGEGLVAYASRKSIGLACGDPLAPPHRYSEAVREYIEHCQRHGWAPCIYMASEQRLETYEQFRMFSRKIADEAIIDLGLFAPGVASPLAAEVHRYDRSAAADPMIDEQLEEVSEDWLETRHMGELGFTSSRFSLEALGDGPVFILGTRDRVEAFCAWSTYRNGRAVVLDLLRQRRNAPPGGVHVLLVQALIMMKSAYEEASVPTATLDRHEIEALNPRWIPRYLVHPRGTDVARIMRALKAIEHR